MIRTQISLEQGQAEAIKKAARRRGVSMSAFIRDAIDRQLEGEEPEGRLARARRHIGKYRSGSSDISVNHDKYLAEDFAD